MTAIFVLTLVMLGLGWIFSLIGMFIHLSECPHSDELLYVFAFIVKTILAAILIVFVCILYGNIN